MEEVEKEVVMVEEDEEEEEEEEQEEGQPRQKVTAVQPPDASLFQNGNLRPFQNGKKGKVLNGLRTYCSRHGHIGRSGTICPCQLLTGRPIAVQ